MNRNLASFDAAEQRNKLSHFTVQGYDLNGVMHVGANDGEEIDNYIRMGIDYIIGVEPLDGVFETLEANCIRWPAHYGIYPKQLRVYKEAFHNRRDYADLYVSIGDGRGSTIMGIDNEDPANFPTVQHLVTRRFDEWYYLSPEVDIKNYDTLLLDTQGNEFEVLDGMGHWLEDFKYLCIELSTEPVYPGETPAQKVADWLEEEYGFIQDSPLYTHNDAFFIRDDIKATSERIYLGRA